MLKNIKILKIDIEKNKLIDIDNDEAYKYLMGKCRINDASLSKYLNDNITSKNPKYTSCVTCSPEWMIFVKNDDGGYDAKYFVIDNQYKDIALSYKNIKSLAATNKETGLYVKEDDITV